MKFTSILAIYSLFWAMSFFLVLPFRPRTAGAPEPRIAGQADSAPPRFSFAKACFWTTIVSAVLFGLFYANYVYGWLGVQSLDFFSTADRRV
ncbi:MULTISPECIES: DUF1467 family protein [Sphingomonadales]|uniref:DUF1467 domain-containing protein n=2 Tax=Edaphosphingomonas TaxID=3423724 RepID=A0A2T4HN36_9SPHN|nr:MULTISPECIES: DUF1467 family protein [Sphingomonas]AGH47779.1 hypothetical protein G432_00245 [Sphingomonas sp. MM-1]MDX3882969.1 DUF1467 family protein [Sphingomonas sp.]OHT20144.1 hypothetical protein BHE75_02139 [Sphingomonas haloaromaticamans]PTD17199.1 DUF1467 domain-containing protein [Sphingomonas fennica]